MAPPPLQRQAPVLAGMYFCLDDNGLKARLVAKVLYIHKRGKADIILSDLGLLMLLIPDSNLIVFYS